MAAVLYCFPLIFSNGRRNKEERGGEGEKEGEKRETKQERGETIRERVKSFGRKLPRASFVVMDKLHDW